MHLFVARPDNPRAGRQITHSARDRRRSDVQRRDTNTARIVGAAAIAGSSAPIGRGRTSTGAPTRARWQR